MDLAGGLIALGALVIVGVTAYLWLPRRTQDFRSWVRMQGRRLRCWRRYGRGFCPHIEQH